MEIINRRGNHYSWSADLYRSGELLFRLSVTDNRRQVSLAELFPEDPEQAHYAYIRTSMPLTDEEILRWASLAVEMLYLKRPMSWRERRRFRIPDFS